MKVAAAGKTVRDVVLDKAVPRKENKGRRKKKRKKSRYLVDPGRVGEEATCGADWGDLEKKKEETYYRFFLWGA